MQWEYRKNKDVIRSYVLPDKSILNGIWLPGEKCLCLNKAFQAGLLTKAKSIILVEKDKHIYNLMVKEVPKLNNIICINSKVENISINTNIDYAFLDYYGGLSNPVSQWIQNHLSPKLTKNATVAITQIVADRGSKIIPAQDEFLRKEAGERIRAIYGILDCKKQRLLMLLHRIFNIWDFEIQVDDQFEIPTYHDVQHHMMVFKLTNFQPQMEFRFPSL